MAKRTVLRAWTILLVLSATTTVVWAAPQQDLRGYDKLAVDYSKTPYLLDSEHQVQNFVWIHWKQRRPGYLVFTLRTVEGDVQTSHLFIEPTKDGSWRVRAIIYDFYSDHFVRNNVPKRPDTHMITKFEAVLVEWVYDSGKHLVLKGKSGKVLQSL